jgi:restriction system protein
MWIFVALMAFGAFVSLPLPLQIVIGVLLAVLAVVALVAWIMPSTGSKTQGAASPSATYSAQNMHGMSGIEFEAMCADVFRRMGYHAALTKHSNDGGVDIELSRDGQLTLVQCKRSARPVGVKVVRELFGVCIHRGASKAIVCTNNTFTLEAQKFAQGQPIELIDGVRLARLL